MLDIKLYVSYSVMVFIIVLISGCILNLLKYHFVFQLFGIAFFFTFSIFKSIVEILQKDDVTITNIYIISLPMLTGISACLISMVLGFWIFPPIRRKFKD